MAPKSKEAAKGSGKSKGKGNADDGSSSGGAGKLKAAQSINVRHILVSSRSPTKHGGLK
jgi:hypothetical protein